MKKVLIAVLLLNGHYLMAQVQARPTPVNKITPVTRPTTLQEIKSPVYDFSNIQFCVDRLPQNNNLPARNFSAVAMPPKINSDGSISNVGVSRQPLAGETNKMWDPGQTLTVFLNTANSTDFVRTKVRNLLREWERVANIKFSFVGDARLATIKVEFASDNANWSWIGKDVLVNPLGLHTVHFGSFTDNTSDDVFRRLVLHEFGHALGFIHEHQSPAAGIQWDKEKVYSFFGGPTINWTRNDVDVNIFHKYSTGSTNFSVYDPFSIMHYAIPPSLTLDGRGTTANFNFSTTDIQHAGRIYPFPVTPSAATGTLRTGDDCDMIDFKVEYNVAPADKVEFVFELGDLNGKKVTWWKQIVIPLTNNREMPLWVQDHSLIPAENRRTATVSLPVAELNNNAQIAFWKAKILGVHTLLPFKWNLIPALRGGCRVRLVWKDDSCS